LKRFVGWLFAFPCLGGSCACAQPARFEHIVLIIQENRTPDNLFFELCSKNRCGAHPAFIAMCDLNSATGATPDQVNQPPLCHSPRTRAT